MARTRTTISAILTKALRPGYSLSSADVPTSRTRLRHSWAARRRKASVQRESTGCAAIFYYANWDLQIQQELPRHFVGSIGYIGSEGHRLFIPAPSI